MHLKVVLVGPPCREQVPLQHSEFVPVVLLPGFKLQVSVLGKLLALPLPLAMQHLRMVVPTWLHATLVPVHCWQVTPPVPQLAFVVPALHMDSFDVVVPQQPSQLVAPQALASHRQVVALKVVPVPHALLTHCWLPVGPHNASPVGHSHPQVVGLRTWPLPHSGRH